MPNSALALRLVSACWQEFARSIPRGGRLLDLGTGLGFVLNEIGRERPDIALVGVDSVASLPTEDVQFQIETGIMMERLPFGACEFDAVSSQFGFEYSDMEATAHELARVLRPGGSAQFLIHDANGIVVRQSARRRSALQWVMEESGIFEKAARLISDCDKLCGKTSNAFAVSIIRARQEGLDPVAAEIASAVNQIIAIEKRSWALHVEGLLTNFVTQARNELVIIEALERVALNQVGIENLRSMLRSAGFEPDSPRVIDADVGAPFAWLLHAQKPAA